MVFVAEDFVGGDFARAKALAQSLVGDAKSATTSLEIAVLTVGNRWQLKSRCCHHSEISPVAALPIISKTPTFMKASFQRVDVFAIADFVGGLISCNVISFFLFPDAEIPEDIAEDFVGGDFARARALAQSLRGGR